MEILVFIFIIALCFALIALRSPKVKGKIGEHTVNEILKSLPSPEYTIYNNLIIKNGDRTSQIDHIIVSPYGIFVIETKNYRGWIFGGENSGHWTQNIWGNKYSIPNPIHQNAGHIYALKNILGLKTNQFISIVAFSHRADLKISVSSNVIYFSQLRNTIKRYSDLLLNDVTIKECNRRLSSIPQPTKGEEREHIKGTKEFIQRNRIAVANGLCPRCGGELVMRSGKYGKFYGCSNYPHCKYTHK